MLKISIIVPVYNTSEYLRACFDCLVAQTYQNFEVIAVDDGSTDDSGVICDEYAAKDSRFKVIHKKNGGVSAARNTGLDAATGDYIGFVDSDDTMLPGMFEEYVRVAKITEADLIESERYLAEGEKANNCNDARIYEFNNEEARREFFTMGKIRPSVCLAIIKRDVVGNLRFPSNIYQWEDYAFIACAVARSKKVAITTNCYYQYRYREGSATKRPLNDRQMTCLLIDTFLKNESVYKSQQEKSDVVGFFTRCCCLNYLQNTPKDKATYKAIIRKHIEDNKDTLSIGRAVPVRERVIIICFLYSENISRVIYNVEKIIVNFLLKVKCLFR